MKLSLFFQLKNDSERGQALVIIAVSFVILLAFVGLTVDVGQLFIQMGHLRRATDAASLAAAAQYREGRTLEQMLDSAQQVMELNGVSSGTVTIETCETNPGDPGLCFTPRRKLVRVIGSVNAPLPFLHLIGIPDVTITSNSIGEAAAMDVVLVIDISESMTSDARSYPEGVILGKHLEDPTQCNALDPAGTNPAYVGSGPDVNGPAAGDGLPGDCHPFEEVKASAFNFISRILDKPAATEADRVSIVVFSNGWENSPFKTGIIAPGWMDDKATALNAILSLEVYEPSHKVGAVWQPKLCPENVPDLPGPGTCLVYDPPMDQTGTYIGVNCPEYHRSGDPSSCTTTNIGGGLKLGGNMFATDTREEALWVVVLLTDGAANASDDEKGVYQYGFCPEPWVAPFCRDWNSATRHSSGNPAYDADDYARDMADFVGCYPSDPASACGSITGQGAVMFSIGLGDQVLSTYNTDPVPHGVRLLRYIGAIGDDGDVDTDPCAGKYDNLAEWKEWCGNYYFSPTGAELDLVFEDIASRIFTRIAH